MDRRLERLEAESARIKARTFWRNPNAWPFDAPGYVFVLRAIHSLGMNSFGDEWPSDIQGARSASDFRDAALTLREHCAFGRLSAAIQWSDGTFDPIPAARWNTRDYEQWFIDFKAPGTVVSDNWHPLANVPECWIFIERSGLDALLGRHAPQAPLPAKAEETEAGNLRLSLTEDELREQGEWPYLASAIEWIAWRGKPAVASRVPEDWDRAERELFVEIAKSGQPVRYSFPGSARFAFFQNVDWSRANAGEHPNPYFTPHCADRDLPREIGGTAHIDGEQFTGIRIAASFIFSRWPGSAGEVTKAIHPHVSPSDNSDSPIAPDPEGAEKYLRQMAAAFINEQGPRMTHRDWLVAAKEKFGVNNPGAREIYGKMPAGFRSGRGRSKNESSRDRKTGIAS